MHPTIALKKISAIALSAGILCIPTTSYGAEESSVATPIIFDESEIINPEVDATTTNPTIVPPPQPSNEDLPPKTETTPPVDEVSEPPTIGTIPEGVIEQPVETPTEIPEIIQPVIVEPLEPVIVEVQERAFVRSKIEPVAAPKPSGIMRSMPARIPPLARIRSIPITPPPPLKQEVIEEVATTTEPVLIDTATSTLPTATSTQPTTDSAPLEPPQSETDTEESQGTTTPIIILDPETPIATSTEDDVGLEDRGRNEDDTDADLPSITPTDTTISRPENPVDDALAGVISPLVDE